MIRNGMRTLLAGAGALVLAACGGSSGTSTYALGGAMRGLAAGQKVTLQIDAGASQALAANRAFTLATPVAAGSHYAVTVGTQPVAQLCMLAGASGTMPAGNVGTVFEIY